MSINRIKNLKTGLLLSLFCIISCIDINAKDYNVIERSDDMILKQMSENDPYYLLVQNNDGNEKKYGVAHLYLSDENHALCKEAQALFLDSIGYGAHKVKHKDKSLKNFEKLLRQELGDKVSSDEMNNLILKRIEDLQFYSYIIGPENLSKNSNVDNKIRQIYEDVTKLYNRGYYYNSSKIVYELFKPVILALVKRYPSKYTYSELCEIIPVDYDDVKSIKGTCLQLKKNGKYGLFDYKKEKEIIPVEYDNIENSRGDNYSVTKNGKKGIIEISDKNSITEINEIIPCEFNGVDLSKIFSDVFIVSQANNSDPKYGLWVNKSGQLVPCEYDEIDEMRKLKAYKVRKGNNVGMIYIPNHFKDKDMNIVPCTYEAIDDLDGNYFRVKQNDKWGVRNMDGKIVVTPKYKKINMMRLGENTFFACYNNLDSKNYDAISTDGQQILSSNYDGIARLIGNSLVVKKGKKCGIIDYKTKKQIIAPNYDYCDGIGWNGNILMSNETPNGRIKYIFSPSGKLIAQKQYTNSELSSQRVWTSLMDNYFGRGLDMTGSLPKVL